jgi:hypothetical protein
MRLINTSTLRFEEFDDVDIRMIGYAILSHRWSKDEVSYQDWLDGNKRNGPGYAKIVKFCQLAKTHEFQWAWFVSRI